MSAWVDLSLMTLTFVFSIVWNVEVGVVVSLIISLLLVVHRSSKTRMTILVSLDHHFHLACCHLSLAVRAGFPEQIDGNR